MNQTQEFIAKLLAHVKADSDESPKSVSYNKEKYNRYYQKNIDILAQSKEQLQAYKKDGTPVDQVIQLYLDLDDLLYATYSKAKHDAKLEFQAELTAKNSVKDDGYNKK